MANNKKDKGRLPQGMHFDEVRGYYVKRFTVEGKRYTVYGKTKTEALAKETDLRQKLNEGVYIKNNAIKLNQYFEEWAQRQEEHIKGATIFNYKTMYANHVRKAIGGMKVQKIERRQIVALYQKVAKTSGPSVANQMKILLGTLLKSAVQDEIIKTNPAENIRRIKTDGGRKVRATTHRALTEEEISTFLNASKKSWYYNIFRFLLATGVRAGECGALKWSDIDFKNGVIHIRRTVTRNDKGEWVVGTSPKTVSSERDIPINGEIKNILMSQQVITSKLHGNVVHLDGTVFTKENGGILTAPSINSIVQNTVARINKQGGHFERFSPHAFRDTFASMAGKKGVPMNVLKVLMGHSSYAMTADLYGHIYDDQKVDAMQKLDEVTV